MPAHSSPPIQPQGPLAGIRVLDLTSVVVGPACTLALAQQGADVIKLEPLEGDLMRRLGGKARSANMSPKFMHFNRGKRSIALDLKHAEGQAIARNLATQCDVLVTNIRPAALARLGLAYDDLAQSAPRLVYCNITGFGLAGPYCDLPAYDTIIQGVSGFSACMERVFGEPRYMPFVITDHITGFIAAQAICAALVARATTGRGQAVEVPMYENMVSFVLAEHLAQRTLEDDGEMGDPRIMNTDSRPTPTLDGYICVSPNTDAQAHAFFRVIGRPELASDPRFTTVAARVANTDAYFEIRASSLCTRPTSEWVELLRAAEIPAMPYNSLDDLFTDPHLTEVGLIEKTVHPTEGPALALAPANTFSESGVGTMREAPLLGADSEAILEDFGYDEAAIAAMRGSGVFA
ncbi:MAG: CoA transferase [Caulobacterales bacterium]